MGGKSTSEQQTQQSSQTNPWEPTQGLLKDIIGGAQSQFGNYQPNSAETGAINTLSSNAANAPNYAPQATKYANDLISGGPDRGGILSSAYDRLGSNLAPTIAGDYLDPNKNPFFANTTNAISKDVQNRVDGMFAGAGRDLSGSHIGTLSREITNATAPIYAQAYSGERDRQLAAMRDYYGAGGQTAQGLQGFDQQGFANRAQGLDVGINGVPQAQNAGAQGVLNAESFRRNLPLQNLGMLSNLTIPIAGLGSQSSGTSNTKGSQTMSGAQQFGTIAQGIGNLGGAFKSFGFGSDRRIKDDIAQIGELYDGTPVYRFRYKGDPRVTVGLMADDIEKFAPEAVGEFGGIKIVDYGAATERAAGMGAE